MLLRLLPALATALQFLLFSRRSGETWLVLPNLSPAPVAVVGGSMAQAERTAMAIPNSYVLLTHGTVRFSTYPNGTALVIQKIAWENLRPGMTVIYYIDQQSTAALAGGLLLRQIDGAWLVPGISGWDANGTSGRGENERGTRSRYAGVVAAAYIEEGEYNSLAMLRESPVPVAGSCVLRCHVANRR
jgi:hypothetical protein